MILDRLANAQSYALLHPRIAQGLAYLQNLRVEAFADKQEPIDTDKLFAMFQQYASKAPEQGKWESHLRYADIQYIYSGIERMDVLPTAALGEPSLKDVERDVIFYPTPSRTPAEQVSLHVPAGSFAIFFPQDAHRPNLRVCEKGGQVQKIVIKVLLDAI